MDRIFDAWPFNIDSGPDFLFFFALLWAASMLVAVLAGEAYAMRREAGEAPGIDDSPSPVGAAPPPYRARPADSARRRLAIGSPPRAGDAWAIAYLRAGHEGLVEALALAAVAAGLVRKEGEKKGQPVEAPADPLLNELHAKLDGVTHDFAAVHAKAFRAATKYEPALKELLGRAGLARDAAVRLALGGAVACAGLVALTVGFVRCWRAEILGRPYTFLALEMLTAAALTAIYASRRARRGRSRRADRYLAWLDDITTSLRRDVLAGRPVSAEESANAVAIGGAVSLVTAPLFVAALPPSVLEQARAGELTTLGSASALSPGGSNSRATSSASYSGSSCDVGGSSCGGGGSSCGGGGSSCGGGGSSCGGGGCGGGGCGG
jgi:uncharacterized protein (TIGR04222 family)